MRTLHVAVNDPTQIPGAMDLGERLNRQFRDRSPSTEHFLSDVTAATAGHAGALEVLGGPRFETCSRETIETLMVGVDGSPLAEAVLPRSVSLARALGPCCNCCTWSRRRP